MQAKNLVGEDVGQVELVASTVPDLPTTPRLLNATSTTLAVAWTQGFNGGPLQKFKVSNTYLESVKSISILLFCGHKFSKLLIVLFKFCFN